MAGVSAVAVNIENGFWLLAGLRSLLLPVPLDTLPRIVGMKGKGKQQR